MLPTMTYTLGLDAGGTKTECALWKEDALLARASGGSIKILQVSTEQAERNLDSLLKAVSVDAGVPLDSIDCTCVGLAGVTIPRVAEWTRAALGRHISGTIVLVGDEEIALDAAFPGGAGVLVVAGTGSNIVGRAAGGELVHVGGWGPALTDEGSGNWIGRQAVRAVFDTLDHGETTLLLERILAEWKLSSIGEFVEVVNRVPGPDFSKLAPLVAEGAAKGDVRARRVLDEAGDLLGAAALLAARRVQAITPEWISKFAFTGSVLKRVAPVRERMCAAIRHGLPEAHIRMEAVDPLQGALWRCKKSCGGRDVAR